MTNSDVDFVPSHHVEYGNVRKVLPGEAIVVDLHDGWRPKTANPLQVEMTDTTPYKELEKVIVFYEAGKGSRPPVHRVCPLSARKSGSGVVFGPNRIHSTSSPNATVVFFNENIFFGKDRFKPTDHKQLQKGEHVNYEAVLLEDNTHYQAVRVYPLSSAIPERLAASEPPCLVERKEPITVRRPPLVAGPAANRPINARDLSASSCPDPAPSTFWSTVSSERFDDGVRMSVHKPLVPSNSATELDQTGPTYSGKRRFDDGVRMSVHKPLVPSNAATELDQTGPTYSGKRRFDDGVRMSVHKPLVPSNAATELDQGPTYSGKGIIYNYDRDRNYVLVWSKEIGRIFCLRTEEILGQAAGHWVNVTARKCRQDRYIEMEAVEASALRPPELQIKHKDWSGEGYELVECIAKVVRVFDNWALAWNEQLGRVHISEESLGVEWSNLGLKHGQTIEFRSVPLESSEEGYDADTCWRATEVKIVDEDDEDEETEPISLVEFTGPFKYVCRLGDGCVLSNENVGKVLVTCPDFVSVPCESARELCTVLKTHSNYKVLYVPLFNQLCTGKCSYRALYVESQSMHPQHNATLDARRSEVAVVSEIVQTLPVEPPIRKRSQSPQASHRSLLQEKKALNVGVVNKIASGTQNSGISSRQDLSMPNSQSVESSGAQLSGILRKPEGVRSISPMTTSSVTIPPPTASSSDVDRRKAEEFEMALFELIAFDKSLLKLTKERLPSRLRLMLRLLLSPRFGEIQNQDIGIEAIQSAEIRSRLVTDLMGDGEIAKAVFDKKKDLIERFGRYLKLTTI